MVIVEAVALATMISNDLVMPALLRIRAFGLEQRRDLSEIVLMVRRVAILLLALLAFAYYRAMAQNQALASFGLLAFVAVAQFAPALVRALYWRSASRLGVSAGLLVGFAVWTYTLLLPSMSHVGWLPQTWLSDGPLGIGWLAPTALFHLSGWDPITHGTFWSLLANIACFVFLSLRFRPSVDERLRARPSCSRWGERPLPAPTEWRGRVSVADLGTVAERILGEGQRHLRLEEYAAQQGKPLLPQDAADRGLLLHTERACSPAPSVRPQPDASSPAHCGAQVWISAKRRPCWTRPRRSCASTANSFPRRWRTSRRASASSMPTCAWWRGTGAIWRCSTTPRAWSAWVARSPT